MEAEPRRQPIDLAEARRPMATWFGPGGGLWKTWAARSDQRGRPPAANGFTRIDHVAVAHRLTVLTRGRAEQRSRAVANVAARRGQRSRRQGVF